jgi:hypothetical protein
MLIRLGKLRQFCLVVYVWAGQFEGALAIGNVRFDVGHAVNFFQIASDRGGAAASRHVGDAECDERQFRGRL